MRCLADDRGSLGYASGAEVGAIAGLVLVAALVLMALGHGISEKYWASGYEDSVAGLTAVGPSDLSLDDGTRAVLVRRAGQARVMP